MFKINRDKELSQLRKAMAEMTRERDRLKKSIEIKEHAISERERELLCEIAKAKELQEKYKEAIKEVALIKNNMKQELKTVIKSAKKELK